MSFGKFQVDAGGIKPWLPGDNLKSDAFASQVEGKPWGFGCPAGAPIPVREITLYARSWERCREFFDRPCLVIPKDDHTGPIYLYECQTAPAYCAGSANWLFDARVFRRGQTIFINRPGRYSFYLDQVAEPVRCLVYDWASIWNDDPHAKYLTGYDPRLPGWRGQGATEDDPAAMWFSNHGGAILFASTPVHTVVAVTAASQLALAANANRHGALFINDDAAIVHYLGLGVAAAANAGVRLNAAGGDYQIDGDQPFLGAVYVVGSAGGPSNLLVTEW